MSAGLFYFVVLLYCLFLPFAQSAVIRGFVSALRGRLEKKQIHWTSIYDR